MLSVPIFFHHEFFKGNIGKLPLDGHSCIDIRYWKLFEARKSHVQIMRFTCCLNMVFNLTKPIWALICSHDVTLEKVAALTDQFANAFVC